MKYEIKTIETMLTETGIEKKARHSYLAENCSDIGDAWAKAADLMEALAQTPDQVYAVLESRIKEVCNPRYKKEHIESDGWTVYLERTFFDDNMKEKRQRYPVLCWSEEIPSADKGELADYLRQIDPERNEFSVVKISKSPVAGVM